MAWEKTASVGGVVHPICKQDAKWSCQMASIAMVVNRHDGSWPTETSVMQISKEHTGSYKSHFTDKPNVIPLPMMAAKNPHQPGGVGTWNENMTPVLAAYKINAIEAAKPSYSDLKKAMKAASPKHPLILREPSHIVVCDGPQDGGYVICDPGRGLFIATLNDAAPPTLSYGTGTWVIDRMWVT